MFETAIHSHAATPARTGKVIFAEFNELCPWLIDQWMAEGLLPNFRAMHGQSAVFETFADVTDPANLEPWIQWYSLHTGLSFDQHKVFHLTEGAQASHDDLWRIAHAAGRKVMNFAGMNARPFDFPGSVYVADPWCENGNASPRALNIYNRFVGANVREYSNPDARLTAADYAKFLSFMVLHGLRPGTVAALAKQLIEERTKDRRLSWKRATLLDRMQMDVFRYYYRKTQPDFATFFINSTAHLQHSYWRQFQPDAFAVRPNAESSALYGDAVKTGYIAMDRLLGAFLAQADANGAMLVLATALSQQPYLAAEDSGGKHFHRLRDVDHFFRRFALPHRDIDPTMTHQYFVRFDSDADRAKTHDALAAFKLADGRALFGFNDRTEDGLYFSCDIYTQIDGNVTVTAPHGDTLKFQDIVYKIDATKSGRHHPAGALWFRTGTHSRSKTPVSILDIFPTTLDLLGIENVTPPDRTGKSLIDQLAI
jgi:Type I phosphodiesterase / nucleotide pyrophosphatase